jgi:hypothetical protein
LTEDIPPLDTQEIVSPPPAYYPPPPNFNLLRTASFPISYGAYDAYSAHQTATNPEMEALQAQYTEYFTQLFTKWIDWAVLFYKYGLPVIKWSCLFYTCGQGGWREEYLKLGWWMVWYSPGLYFDYLKSEVKELKERTDAAGPGGNPNDWIGGLDLSKSGHPILYKLLYNTFFWGTWSSIFGVKFGSLLYITWMKTWWKWLAWGVWILACGI